MANGRDRRVLRVTEIIIAVIIAVTGIATFLSYGSEGFTNWDFMNWFNAWGKGKTPVTEGEEVSEPAAQASGYELIVPGSTAAHRALKASTDGSDAETKLVFEGVNFIGDINTDSGKGSVWLSENVYDAFTYTLTLQNEQCLTRKDREENWFGGNIDYPYLSTFTADDYGLYIIADNGMAPPENNKVAGAVYCASSDTTSKDKVTRWQVIITERQLKLCALGGDFTTPIWSKTYGTDTKDYTEFKNYLLEGSENVCNDWYENEEITEEIAIYKTDNGNGPEVPLPEEPTKEGYHFVGWFYDETFTNPYITGQPIYENTKLYAKFDINVYHVSFYTIVPHLGTASLLSWADYEWNNTVILPEDPVERGYNFLGWYLEDGTEYTGGAVTEDINLYAHWEIKVLTVTFYVGGEVYATREVEYGTRFAELAEEAKAANLRLLTVMTADGEQAIEALADSAITSDYAIKAESLTAAEIVQNVIKANPWIFLPIGGGLAVIVGIIGIVLYCKQGKAVKRSKRKY